ncbi:unnamed protein product [Ilex paraguariensis]|uniref:Uncharacterized protein n=1 Tax=Ilex paraguariensis TaxID=185542 RepID=A0ABC8TNH7_9AQUA
MSNGIWSTDLGFLESLDDSVGRENDVNGTMKELVDSVKWPGDLEPPRVPKGWSMPTAKNKLKIGFPSEASFKQFVNEIEKFLEYRVLAEFVESESSYDELVARLADKFGSSCIDLIQNSVAHGGISLPSRFGSPSEKVQSNYTRVVVGEWLFVVLILTQSYTASDILSLRPSTDLEDLAFQKGSPIAVDVSDAILHLSENGKLKELEDRLFTPSSECSTLQIAEDKDSLQIQSF